MAYIGKQPLVGNYTVLDSLTATTTDTYALTKGAVAVFPQTPANCIVSLNGVIQAPFDSYTISGSNIVFASALTASDSIDFITVLGDVLNVGTVSDGTIGISKLSATGTPSSSTFLRGDNTFASAGGANTPAFHAKMQTSGQSISHHTQTTVIFNTETFDTNNCYDVSTGKFIPTVAGKYYIYTQLTYGALNSSIYFETTISVNGTNYCLKRTAQPITYPSTYAGMILNLNGTTDFVTIETYHEDSVSRDIYADTNGRASFFGAYKIIE